MKHPVTRKCGAMSLAQQDTDCKLFYWCPGRWGRKEGGCESLGSCLNLSVLVMSPKVDCQKPRSLLSKYFIVDSSLSTFEVPQNYLKMGHFGE